MAKRVLFCSSEVYPLIKTGGLADVAGSLPPALNRAGHHVRIVLPAYQSVLDKLSHPPKLLSELTLYERPVRILRTTLPGSRVAVLLVDCSSLFDRPGNPYHDDTGVPWHDNALRFALFCRAITALALNQADIAWQPDVVHLNDWQCGLVPALLEDAGKRPATVFTIHNLAYQGSFDRGTFEYLDIPEYHWHFERLEYHGQFSFIKGGLVYADRINTVSPNYAREIQTPVFSHGLDALLQHRSDRLSGILNGIDEKIWNPGTDKLLAKKYNRQRINDKYRNKRALQNRFSLPASKNIMLLSIISRLAEQKGIDMLLAALPELMKRPVQLAILGSGDKVYESQLQQAAEKWPYQIGLHLGYDETLAHLIEAGADVFLMPSRFEPCGLNQMYSQRYGTLPVVTPVGGLYDTVVDATEENQQNGTATGFVMTEINEASLVKTIDRAIQNYQKPGRWRHMLSTAMSQDFSWEKSAEDYGQLYQQAKSDNPKPF